MKGYIDIHCHILPGIDDGAGDLTVVEEMLSMAYASGIETIIATPHIGKGFTDVTQEMEDILVQQVQQVAEDLQPTMKILPGAEYMFQFRMLEEESIIGLAGSRYVLVEFSPMSDFVAIRTAVEALVMKGYWPVIAHIERYPCFYKKIYRVRQLIEKGAYIQVNALGFRKGWMRRDLHFVRQLFEAGLIDFIGTDGHNGMTRRPVFYDFVEYAQKKNMESEIPRILIQNPKNIIYDKPMRVKGNTYDRAESV